MEGMEIKKTLGRNIKLFRSNLSLSQAALAERAGISITFLSDIERGNKWPYLDTLVNLAKALNTELFELLKPPGAVSPDAAGLLTRYAGDAAAQLSASLQTVIAQSLESLRRQYLRT